MAGGMGRRDGPTLAERSAATTSAPVEGGAGSAAAQRVRPAGRRHCWVQGRPEHPGRWPGLLVEWRQGPDPAVGWEGRVVYVVSSRRGALLLEEWVPADQLESG